MSSCIKSISIKLGIKRPPLPPQRIIPIGPISKNNFIPEGYSLSKLYGDNEITTSRYTWYGFIFQNLSEQAQRIANFYFILIAIVQIFTDSPVTPIISILPLVFVFGVTMIKQGYEDFLRHKADREVNNIKVEVVTEDGHLKTIRARDITVGDIILCRSNNTFPCDMLLLSSSESNGECFVTTASLDGETNLKQFAALEHTQIFDSPELLAQELRGTITCQQPVDDLYSFNGRINLEASNQTPTVLPVGPSNLLLRGACLRNTDFIYGCAVYTGQDTKMMLNSKGKQTKFSQIERKLNLSLALILCFMVICAILSCVLSYTAGNIKVWYVSQARITPWLVIQTFLGFMVLYNYIIPISLYVTIEIQKFISSIFFEWDVNLYDQRINERAKVNTSDLIEEMGQIEYLFTDKTGTLTENCMQFRRIATATGVYGVKENGLYLMEPVTTTLTSTDANNEEELAYGRQIQLTDKNGSVDTQDAEVRCIHTLLLVLSLCHTVRLERYLPGEVPKKKKKKRKRLGLQKHNQAILSNLAKIGEPPRRGSNALRRASAAKAASAAVRSSRAGRAMQTDDYIYQASSPDEKSFVETSHDLGVIYHGTDECGMQVVTLHGEAFRYRQLDLLEFDATRKCMSIILQPVFKYGEEMSDPPVIVLCKGAESTLLAKTAGKHDQYTGPAVSTDLLSQQLSSNETLSALRMSTDDVLKHVTAFACSGLRTLVMGARILTADEWRQYRIELDTARGLLEGREQALSAIYSKIESQLYLLGCTGIEDMLQSGVPETITALREAGIQVWVLTGDKEETAVNISYSAGHFFRGMQEARVTKMTDLHSCQKQLDHHLERISEAKKVDERLKIGVVVDGQSLQYAMNLLLRDRFTKLCLAATTVLCCRLTPIQKADVVRLIKETRSPPPVTAAIGDGANDVSMILEAHVSFGLFGKEGRQAARAADYAFGRFKFLKRAILFHGHTFYIRVAMLVLYFFYKNLLFTLPQMFFGFFCAYSAQTVYPEVYLIFFNLTMTAVPIFLYGIFEKPVPERVLLRHPSLYRSIVRNRTLSVAHFALWLALAIWHALVLFFGTYFISRWGQAGGGSSPQTNYGGSAVGELYGFGNLLVMLIFLTTNIKVFLFTYYINWPFILGWFLAMLLNFSMFAFLNFYLFPVDTPAKLYGTWTALWGGSGLGTGWLAMLALIVLSLLPDLIWRALVDQGWTWRLQMLEKADRMRCKSWMLPGDEMEDLHTEASEENLTRAPTPMESEFTETYDYTNPTFEWNTVEDYIRSTDETTPRNRTLPVKELFERGPIEPKLKPKLHFYAAHSPSAYQHSVQLENNLSKL